jgi:eukaryotic-like serine/threonine-protein kinase
VPLVSNGGSHDFAISIACTTLDTMVTPEPVPPADAAHRLAQTPGVEGRYRSLLVIGRGGMGSVEVALDQSEGGLQRFVALKRLLPEDARDPRRKEMFLREARLAALLRHPNVVHAFAFGEIDGELFLAMEYVEGEPLSRVLAAVRDAAVHDSRRKLDEVLVAYILAQVCEGLHAAHDLRDAGGQPLHVVHRDVSPHNVMIAYDGHVKVLDFGVAKFEAAGHQTRTGEVKGKMAYMSPEQALGDRLDRRSDLFSVGAVLFECLAGRRMWGAGTDIEIMRKLALEEPPWLSDAVPGAPAPLVALHARLVARSASRRPATAGQVAEELRAFVASSRAGVDRTTVRTLMEGLFRREAQERRTLLDEALARAALSRVESLQRSLDSEQALDRPGAPEPMGVPTPPRDSERRGGPRAAVVVGTGLVLLGAVAAGATSTIRRGARVAPAAVTVSATATATATGTATATATATGTTTATMGATVSATATGFATATATATATSAAIPSASTSASRAKSQRDAAPRARSIVTTRPAAGSSKLPDVDPTPF